MKTKLFFNDNPNKEDETFLKRKASEKTLNKAIYSLLQDFSKRNFSTKKSTLISFSSNFVVLLSPSILFHRNKDFSSRDRVIKISTKKSTQNSFSNFIAFFIDKNTDFLKETPS